MSTHEGRIGVKGYRRTTKSGKVVNVRHYHQQRDLLNEMMKALNFDRPPLSASPGAHDGQYPAGRSVPGLPATIVNRKKVARVARVAGRKRAKAEAKAAAPAPHLKVLKKAGFEVEPPPPPEHPRVTEAKARLKVAGYRIKPPKPPEQKGLPSKAPAKTAGNKKQASKAPVRSPKGEAVEAKAEVLRKKVGLKSGASEKHHPMVPTSKIDPKTMPPGWNPEERDRLKEKFTVPPTPDELAAITEMYDVAPVSVRLLKRITPGRDLNRPNPDAPDESGFHTNARYLRAFEGGTAIELDKNQLYGDQVGTWFAEYDSDYAFEQANMVHEFGHHAFENMPHELKNSFIEAAAEMVGAKPLAEEYPDPETLKPGAFPEYRDQWNALLRTARVKSQVDGSPLDEQAYKDRLRWNMFFQDYHDELAAEVSQYGAESYHEFFAEAWAEYKTNPNARRAPKLFGSLLETVMQRATTTPAQEDSGVHHDHAAGAGRAGAGEGTSGSTPQGQGGPSGSESFQVGAGGPGSGTQAQALDQPARPDPGWDQPAALPFMAPSYPTQGERDAVNEYNGKGFHLLNRDLRKGGPLGESQTQMHQQMQNLAARSTVSQDTTLWRSGGSKLFFDPTPGTVFSDKGWVSTEHQRNYTLADPQGPPGPHTIYQIDVPAGSHAIDMSHAAGWDTGEYEVVLPPGTRFQVVSSKQVGKDTEVHVRVLPEPSGGLPSASSNQISREDLTNPDTPRTRAVSAKEFEQLRLKGKAAMAARRKDMQAPRFGKGLPEEWDSVKADAWKSMQDEWGGITVDAHSGERVQDGEKKWALSMKTGHETVAIPIGYGPLVRDATMQRLAHTKADGSLADQVKLDDGTKVDLAPGEQAWLIPPRAPDDAPYVIVSTGDGSIKSIHGARGNSIVKPGELDQKSQASYKRDVQNEGRLLAAGEGAPQQATNLRMGVTHQEFNEAMDTAQRAFGQPGGPLWVKGAHLGVFRNEDTGNLEIDPVLVVDSLDQVESIGAYTHAIGGAYSFADGLGYWPPYIDERAASGRGAGEGLPQGDRSVARAGEASREGILQSKVPAQEPQSPPEVTDVAAKQLGVGKYYVALNPEDLEGVPPPALYRTEDGTWWKLDLEGAPFGKLDDEESAGAIDALANGVISEGSIAEVKEYVNDNFLTMWHPPKAPTPSTEVPGRKPAGWSVAERDAITDKLRADAAEFQVPLQEFYDRFPRLAKHLHEIDAEPFKVMRGGPGSPTDDGVNAVWWNPQVQGGPAIWVQPGLDKSTNVNTVGSYFSMYGDGYSMAQNTVTHELGHHLYESLSQKAKGRVVKAWMRESGAPPELFTLDDASAATYGMLVFDNVKDGVAFSVSQYGATNLSEMMAEIWAEYANNPKARPYIKAIGKVMEHEGKRWTSESGSGEGVGATHGVPGIGQGLIGGGRRGARYAQRFIGDAKDAQGWLDRSKVVADVGLPSAAKTAAPEKSYHSLKGGVASTKKQANTLKRADDGRHVARQAKSNFYNETTGAPMGQTETGDTFEQLFIGIGKKLVEKRYGKFSLVAGAGSGSDRTTPLDLRTESYGGELKSISSLSPNQKTAIHAGQVQRKLEAVATERLKPLLLVQVVDQANHKVSLYGMETFGSKAVSKMEHFGDFTYTAKDFQDAQKRAGHHDKAVARAAKVGLRSGVPVAPVPGWKADTGLASGMYDEQLRKVRSEQLRKQANQAVSEHGKPSNLGKSGGSGFLSAAPKDPLPHADFPKSVYDAIQPGDKVYVHPQGATIIDRVGAVTKFNKAGLKNSSTSATSANLATGHGGWKRVANPKDGPINPAAEKVDKGTGTVPDPKVVIGPAEPEQKSGPAPYGKTMAPMEFLEAPLADIPKYIKDDNFLFQQKVDGIRAQLVIEPGKKPWFRSKSGGQLKSGAATKITDKILKNLGAMPAGGPTYSVDGEVLNGQWYVFDTVIQGQEKMPWEDRMAIAENWVKTINDAGVDLVNALPTARTTAEKQKLYDAVYANGGEGVMMKRRDAPYAFDKKVNTILKGKFRSTADVVVVDLGRNGHDSATLAVWDKGKLTEIGSSSLLGKQKTHQFKIGDVVEVSYLYAFPESQNIVQPTIIRHRPDKDPKSATMDQLRFVNKEVLDQQVMKDQGLKSGAPTPDDTPMFSKPKAEVQPGDWHFWTSIGNTNKILDVYYDGSMDKKKALQRAKGAYMETTGDLPKVGAPFHSERVGTQGLKSGAPKPAMSIAAKHAQHAVNFEDQRKGKVTPLKIEPEALAVAMQAAGVKVTPDLKIRLRLRTMKGKDPEGFTSKIGPNEFRVVIEVKDKPAYEDKHLYVLNNSLIHEMRHVAQHQSDPTFNADYMAEMHKTGYTQNKFEAEARKFGHLADHTGTKPLAPGAKAVGKAGWAIQPVGNTVVTPSVPPKESLTGGSTVLDATKWKQVGEQGGSNTGGYFEDEKGNRFYVKKAADPNRASNEVLAASLYKEAGVSSAEQQLVTTPFNGALGTASPVIPGAKQDLNLRLRDEKYKAKLQEGFAVDAWLANWDVAGLVFDNVVSDAQGNPVRVDPGGALWYRAMASSGPKGAAFGDVVGELETFKNTANTSGAIFGNITPEQEVASAKKVVAVTPERIDALVDAANFKDKSIATSMKARLKARREFIAKRYGLSLSEQQGLASRAKRDSQTSQRAMESRVERLRALVG